MAISINPLVSPRIITVLAPDTAITMQELVDQVRDWEDQQVDIEYDHLIDASGKQSLGAGVSVGITVTLRNAQLAFEARPGPTYVQCNVTGGNLVAVDESSVPMNPIAVTAYTQVVVNNQVGGVIATSPADVTAITNAVWSKSTVDSVPAGSYGKAVSKTDKNASLIPASL
jgi:hypothetical protein